MDPREFFSANIEAYCDRTRRWVELGDMMVVRDRGEFFLSGMDRIVSPSGTPPERCDDGYRFRK